jgi:hypothetical protein
LALTQKIYKLFAAVATQRREPNMAKKNWIYIKRGLSEDPKHREAMGMAVWLFMHICDAADFEKGIVYDWRDKEIAIDMSISTNTVRDWRARLVEKGYITCQQRQHGIEIVIHNWTNPRDYSGKKVNVQGKPYTPPLENNNPQGESQGESQVLNPSTIESSPFIESESESISLRTDEVKEKYKTKATLPAGSSLDWQIATGAEITQADLDLAALKDEAPKMFEKAFGTGQWPWWSNSVWDKFARFVIEAYSKDKSAFGNYIVWRAGAGKYTGFSNKKIRENPTAFMDTGWPEFELTQAQAASNQADESEWL